MITGWADFAFFKHAAYIGGNQRVSFDSVEHDTAFLARYVPQVVSLRNPRLRYFEYDWSINEPGSRHRSASPFERELAAGLSN